MENRIGEITCLCMDLPKETKIVLNENRKRLTENMTDAELKAYDYGIATALGLQNTMFQQMKQSHEAMLVHIPGCKMATEETIENILIQLGVLEEGEG